MSCLSALGHAASACGANLGVLVVDDNLDSAGESPDCSKCWATRFTSPMTASPRSTWRGAVKPEVVLLDIGLPGMDGYEVARHLRTEHDCPDALLIAVSGYGQPDDVRRAKDAGFDQHFVKPLDNEMLMTLFSPRMV